MDILMSETCWAHKKWNNIASDIKLVFHTSTITMMHGPINIIIHIVSRLPAGRRCWPVFVLRTAQKFLSPPEMPDRLWSPFSCARWLLPYEQGLKTVRFNIHLHIAYREPEWVDVYLHYHTPFSRCGTNLSTVTTLHDPQLLCWRIYFFISIMSTVRVSKH